MNTIDKPEATPADALKGLGWPAFVVALLAGHICLMMIAVIWSRTIPKAVTPVEDVAIESIQPPAAAGASR